MATENFNSTRNEISENKSPVNTNMTNRVFANGASQKGNPASGSETAPKQANATASSRNREASGNASNETRQASGNSADKTASNGNHAGRPALKLNINRTMMIGFAFLGILLLWQVYDSWCPTFLTDIFSRRLYGESSAELLLSGQNSHILRVQWIVGSIMACDNLAALILLPVFGSLSDKTRSPIGKRMPYILTGSIITVFVFPLIPYFFHKGHIGLMISAMVIVLISMMMYRNPAVSLMPDITPKPLRTRANSIINIMGYVGGASATILGILFKLSSYINSRDTGRHLYVIETPFLVASTLIFFSTLILFFTIKENKLQRELADELALGEELSEIKATSSSNEKMSKKNKHMLFAILAAEFLWFMGDNALNTYLGNFVIYYLRSSSAKTMLLIISNGAGSMIGFCLGGHIADKAGKRNTIFMGLVFAFIAYSCMSFIRPSSTVNELGEHAFPAFLYGICLLKGFGMALVFNASYPMVLDLCSSDKIGRFTGYYYAASMSAQTITPILLGFILTRTLAWNTLPVYSSIMLALSICVILIFTKNNKENRNEAPRGFDAIGVND